MTDSFASDMNRPRLYLLGALCLQDVDGTDLTPKSKKAQALLALLALAPRGIRTRIWLRDKLWSDSDAERASGSLRQTIFEMRRSLEALSRHVLTCERNALTLHLDELWIDVRAFGEGSHALPDDFDPTAELLEGLDVGDDEFEDWLCVERSAWEDKREDYLTTVSARPVPVTVLPRPPEITIGILPSIVHGGDGHGAYIGDYITESVARALSEYQPVHTLDMRTASLAVSSGQITEDPAFLLRSRTLVVGDSVSVTFLVYGPDGTSLLLSQSLNTRVSDFTDDDFALANQFVAQNVDNLAKLFDQPRGFGGHRGLRNGRNTLVGYHTLAGMFDLNPGGMRAALEMLDRMEDRLDGSLLTSLKAYSTSFALGENIGNWDPARREMTEKLVADVLQQNPFNSIALACIGHTFGFVLERHDVAAEIFARAVTLNPMQAFVWDHFALHKLYCGDLEEARKASDKAVRLGNYSPISYTYDTTACMIAALQGDYAHASQLGARALAKQPSFNAAMRYRLVALGHLGEREEAGRLRSSLLALDPDFSDKQVQAERFRLPLQESKTRVIDGLARAGL